ncbi:MAG: 5'-nucleotidase C-terminal domain-containing protein, partial [Acidaminobacteraceae bacterium]
MKSNMSKFLVMSLVFVLALGFAFNVNFAADEEVMITILQTSDMHGRIYPHDYATDSNDLDAGYAKINTIIKEERSKNPNTILMDTGDTLQDNSADLFNDLPIHPMVQAMNSMNYDVWTIGNHEFNFELDFLKKNIEAFEGDVLASNIYKKGTDERWIAPYVIKEIDGVRVAIVGMLPPYIPTWEASSPSHFAGLEFTGVLEETGKVLKELEGKYDVLIGAYHVGPEGEHGYEGVEEVANAYPQFDVIFSGHAHARYTEEINGVQIIEPGSYGWALAKADIKFNMADKKVVSVETINLETYNVDADESILEEFKFVHDESLTDANTIIGKILNDYIVNPDFITGEEKISTMPTSQIEDTSIIDLINDVQMFYAKSDVSSAALFNMGSNLLAGDFKKKDVAYIYKYSNTLVGVKITGENLLKYMEWSANYYNTYEKGDVTVSFNRDVRGYNYDMFSGLTYDVNISKESGSRIENVIFNGKALDPAKEYKLAVNNYRFGTLMSLGLITMEDKYYDSYEAMQDKGRIRDLI